MGFVKNGKGTSLGVIKQATDPKPQPLEVPVKQDATKDVQAK